jgi:hypothetical protein|tara:strand:+ start:61 stop:276 length:216 start_codon:yes stop_codon:yes gene_type:complete
MYASFLHRQILDMAKAKTSEETKKYLISIDKITKLSNEFLKGLQPHQREFLARNDYNLITDFSILKPYFRS